MTRKERLHIAKEAYKGIMHAIKSVEGYLGAEVKCSLPLYIQVDKDIFYASELEKKQRKKNEFLQ